MAVFVVTGANAATLSLATTTAPSGFKVTVLVDVVTELAGAKLVLHYDQDTLSFLDARKTPSTGSFMHVVNSKKPGEVIVVLASAKGISGDKVPLIEADFSLLANRQAKSTLVQLKRCELMSENLQAIPCNLAGPTEAK